MTLFFGISSLMTSISYIFFTRKFIKLLRPMLHIIIEDNSIFLHKSSWILLLFSSEVIIRIYPGVHADIDDVGRQLTYLIRLGTISSDLLATLGLLIVEKSLRKFNSKLSDLIIKNSLNMKSLITIMDEYLKIESNVNALNKCYEYIYFQMPLLCCIRTILISLKFLDMLSDEDPAILSDLFALFSVLFLSITLTGRLFYSCWCSSLLTEQVSTFIFNFFLF